MIYRSNARPHHGEDAELQQVRRPVQPLHDEVVFLRLQAVLGDEFGGDFGHDRSDCEMNVIPETAQPLSGTQCVRVRSLHPWVPALAALGRDDGKGVW